MKNNFLVLVATTIFCSSIQASANHGSSEEYPNPGSNSCLTLSALDVDKVKAGQLIAIDFDEDQAADMVANRSVKIGKYTFTPQADNDLALAWDSLKQLMHHMHFMDSTIAYNDADEEVTIQTVIGHWDRFELTSSENPEDFPRNDIKALMTFAELCATPHRYTIKLSKVS